MVNRLLQSVTGAVVVLLFVAAPAHAQTSTSALVPRGDVFAGVAFWNEDEKSFTGFHLTGTWRLVKHIGIVGDMVMYGDDLQGGHSSLMGGVRVLSSGRHTVFGQVLIGKAPLDDDAVVVQPGLGVDVRLSRRAAVRGGFDFKIREDRGDTYIGTRFSVGLVLLLGQQ